MKRLFDPCAGYHERICLLSSEDLPREERDRVEKHLAECAGCRKYRDEMVPIAGLLANWEKSFAEIEPRQAAKQRWERDFISATEAREWVVTTLMRGLLIFAKDMVTPNRRIWAGIAATWLLIALVNLSERETRSTSTVSSNTPPPEIIRAFLVQQGLIPEVPRTLSPPKPEGRRASPQA